MADYKTRAEVILDEKWATTPDMGEYLDNDLLLDAAEELTANGKDSMFCVEEPFAKAPGYYPEQNVFVFSGRPTFQSNQNGDNGLNKTDGDTIYLDYSEIIDNGVSTGPTFTNENTNETLKQTIYRICGLENSKDDVGIRLVGINAPEVPHYRELDYDPGFHKTIQVEYRKLHGKSNDDLISTSDGLYRKSQFSYVKYNPNTSGFQKRDSEELITFVKGIGTNQDTKEEAIQFFEMIKRPLSENTFNGEYKICLSHSVEDEDDTEYFRQAIDAQHALMKLMNDAKEIVYIVDQTSIADKASGTIPWAYKKEWEKISQNPIYAYMSLWKNLTQEGEVAFRQMGRRYFGQELNGRLLGAIYVKLNTSYGDQWINVGKYLISQFDKIEILPSYNDIPSNNDNYGYLSDAFKLWSYNKGKQHYVDALDDFRSEKGGDDRAEIQKVLTGIELNEVTNHTVMIGDCLLMVPPTSIRVVSQTRSERISMLRSKGSITKTIPKNERIIEMNLFFNGDEGINGIPYDYTTPNGTKLTYHMNGLRALVSQFKFTPFLPIHNDYINYVLNIEAVSLVSYNISTMPNYPRTLQCTIRLQEFDYRQYMPELLPPDPENREDLFTNIFSKTIHFPVMRYYYQRSILTGETIKDFEFNSEDYYRATLGQKTALQPMKFQSPMFNLYIANEEHLKQRKMLKESLERNPIESVITFNQKEEAFLKDIAKMYQAVVQAMASCYNYNSEMFTPDASNGEKNLVLLSRNNSIEKTIYEKDFSNKINDTMGIYHGFLKNQNIEDVYDKQNVYVYVQTKSKTDIWDEYMKPIREKLLTAVRNNFNSTYIKDVNFAYKQIGTKSGWEDKTFESTFCWGLEIDIDWNALGYKETLDKVKRMYAKQLNVTVNSILKDGKIFIGFSATFKRRSKENGADNIFVLENLSQPDTYKDTDYDMFSKLANNYGIVIDGKSGSLIDGPSEDMWTSSNDIGEMKDNIDLESDKSIIFDEYPIGYPIINSVSFTYNNVFTNMSLKAFDGYAAQYNGGSDTAIEINMTATDEFTVNQLSNLSRICVQRLIDFRKIMSSSPLRIDSEMTRFMGVNEVVIESIDINTVPNYPGTWDISMRLMSVDRTLRNREAMKKLNIDNHENNMDNTIKTKNFFEIKNALAKVELYPDLELPTLSELEKLGYYYIRYKANGERIFPDADFYFVYLHVYSSQMFRQAIVEFFRDSSKSSTLYHKLSGNLFGEDVNIAYKLRQNSEDKLDKKLYEYESNGYVKEMEDEIKRVTSLMNDPGTNKSEMKQTEESITELQNKVTSMNESILSMREVLDSTNFDSYDFNSVTKVSVKDKSYFNQENSLLTEKSKYRVYNRKDGFKSINDENKVKNMNASLKELILEILSNPINTKVKFYSTETDSGNINYDKSNTGTNNNTAGYDKGNQAIDNNSNTRTSSVISNKSYTKLIEYLVNDIGGCTSGLNTSFTLADTNGKMFSLSSLLSIIMNGSARAASAKLGVYDITKDNKKDSEPRQVVERTLPQSDGTFKTVKYPNVLYTESGQVSTILLASNDKERAQGFIFGSYGIKKYSPDMLSMMYSITLTHAGNGFLDPYYNPDLAREVLRENLSKEDGEAREVEYIKNIVENEAYGENAFFRTMLCWLYKLLDDNNTFLPSPIYLMGEMDKIVADAREQDDYWWDNIGQWFKKKSVGRKVNKLTNKKEDSAFSDEDQTILSAKEYELRLMETETELENEIEQMRKDIVADLPRYRLSLLNGLFLTLSTLALTEFNTPVYSAIKSGDISTYVGYVEKIKSSYLSAQDLNDDDIKIRKLYQYLDYQFDKSSYTYDKINYKGPADKYSSQGKNQRIYLEAADTPSVYLMHSFYDMIMTDMRGRMARAFPTYYMLLIDEGRDLGVWRLQDNFYDVSSIVEFQVVKSRKIAADTAKIVMTNLFGTFTTEDDDIKDEYQYTFKDMWNSIMSPRQYVSKEYQRKQEARDINRAKLKPGARVHLRMGYSGDASSLPIVFNGSVAEVVPGDLMTIICQGDGVELANPAMFNPTDAKDVADLQYNDNLISSFLGLFKDNTTPRDILLNPLIAEGTFLHEIIKDWSKGRLFNANPFGLSHFGDKHFKDIFTNNGEIEQNIYEALSKPSWGKDITVDTNDYSYSMSDAPKIRVGLTSNRSYWDLMHIAASVSPDFICAVAPFQMRSTIFYGHPRYYYAYDYEKLPNGQINEKRKPFQQYHIYTSYTDIISNQITASDKDIRTVAVGVYTGPGMFSEKTKSVGPLYLDIDIYPEKQKTTNINCNFEYRNLDIIPFTIPVVDYAVDELGENGGYQIAWRATAMGLKDTVKDMYTGELIVMGDPSVKPYDKMFVHDTYEDIQGMAEVETVVHSFSVETGFTTSITPDCISAIDNKYEQISNSTIRELITPVLSSHTALVMTGNLYQKINRALFFSASQAVKNFGDASGKIVNAVGGLLGKENIVKYSEITDKVLQKAGLGFGVTATDYVVYSSVKNLSTGYDLFKKERTIKSGSDIAKLLDDMLNLDSTLTKMSPEKLLNELNNISNPKDEVKAAIKSAESLKEEYTAGTKAVLNANKIGADDLKTIVNSIKQATNEVELADDLAKSLSYLEDLISNGKSIAYNSKDFKKGIDSLKSLTKYADDLGDGSELLSAIKNLDANIFQKAKATFKSFDKVDDMFKAVNGIRKGAGALKSVLTSNILWLAAEIVLTKSLQEFLERKLKNLQVLTVFPMMKNGKVYTAGLDGNKGSVFGSPSYTETGFIEEMAIKFFEKKEGIIGGSLGFIRDLFITTPEMLETVDAYRRDNGYGSANGSSEVQRISEEMKLLEAVTKSNISGFTAYKQLYFDARVQNSNSQEALNALNKYKLVEMNKKDIFFGKTIAENLVPVYNMPLIAKLSDNGVFKFVGEEGVKIETDSSKVTTENYVLLQTVEGAEAVASPCKVIESGNSEIAPVYVLPYLRQDTAIVLEMVVEEVCKKLQPDYESSDCKFEYLHQHNFVLHNGVRINDNGAKGKGSWFSTGFAFTLEVKNYKEFGNIIKEINDKDISIEQSGEYTFRLLNIQKDSILAGQVYSFWVSPKK